MVSYSANRIYANVPFPDGATDIVFDERRPYLSCIAPRTVDANLDFFRKGLRRIGLVAIVQRLNRSALAERQS